MFKSFLPVQYLELKAVISESFQLDMADLAGLVQRLEVAVGRLEVMSGPGGAGGSTANTGGN